MSEKLIKSDAASYFKADPDADMFYEIFFSLCRKFNVSWSKASEKEKKFIEELTRYNYEKKKGLNPTEIFPLVG